MLAIRLQRLGRKGYAVYRIAVQEAQRHPTSGRVIAYVGSYNPHTKEVKVDAEKVEKYLNTGAQPSPRVVKLLVEQKVKLPDWVQKAGKKEKTTRNPEKLRKNQPEQLAEPEASAEVKEEVSAETEEKAPIEEKPATEAEEKMEKVDEIPVEEVDPEETTEPEV